LGSTTAFESRLKARVRELGGSAFSEHYEIHHVNKAKKLTRKKPWEIVMTAQKRKTMAVCKNCRNAIHGS
jgi:uncharacterized pyridoxal phosphate-containing UPF0001 family protein